MATPSKTLYQEQPKNIVNVVTQTLRRLQLIRVNRLLQGAWRDAYGRGAVSSQEDGLWKLRSPGVDLEASPGGGNKASYKAPPASRCRGGCAAAVPSFVAPWFIDKPECVTMFDDVSAAQQRFLLT
jgi:hypothetical protein